MNEARRRPKWHRPGWHLALISAFDRRMQDMLHHQRFHLRSSSPTKRQVSPIGFPCEWIIVSSLPFDTRERLSALRAIVEGRYENVAEFRDAKYNWRNGEHASMLKTWKVIFVENCHVGGTFLFFRFNGSLCQGPIVCSLCSIERLFNAQSDNLSDLLLKRRFLQIYRRTDR